MTSSRLLRRSAALAALAALPLAAPVALAQTPAPVVRTYVPPNQLVAFQETVGFDRFLSVIDPIFHRVTGKRVVDPEGRTDAIGVPIQGMHFMDAFVYVLSRHGLTYKETDRYFVIQSQEEVRAAEEAQRMLASAREAQAAAEAAAASAEARANMPVTALAPTAGEAASGQPGARTSSNLYLQEGGPRATPNGTVENVSIDTREIRINAIVFDLNVTKSRDLGINWRTFFTSTSPANTVTPSGAIPTQSYVDLGTVDLGPFKIPSIYTFQTLTQFFRFLEDEGVGRTVANPSVTVQSGREGRIQVGQDVPVTTKDFQGNTQVQLIPTGIITKVVPTLVVAPLDDSEGAPNVNFIHLDALIERSSPGLFNGSVSISRNQTTTNVLLLDGEQTIVGGLYSTERTQNTTGIWGLRSLPVLGKLFSSTETLETQREMIIVLQAEVVRSVADRYRTPTGAQDLLEQRRQEVRERMRTTTPALERGVDFGRVRQ